MVKKSSTIIFIHKNTRKNGSIMQWGNRCLATAIKYIYIHVLWVTKRMHTGPCQARPVRSIYFRSLHSIVHSTVQNRLTQNKLLAMDTYVVRTLHKYTPIFIPLCLIYSYASLRFYVLSPHLYSRQYNLPAQLLSPATTNVLLAHLFIQCVRFWSLNYFNLSVFK